MLIVGLAVEVGERRREGAWPRAAGRHRGRAPRRSAPWRAACAKAVELGLGVVAQIADRSPAGAGQDVERIGDVLAALVEVVGIGDAVGRVVEGDGRAPAPARRSPSRRRGSGSR